MQNKISIIIPVYNSEAFLHRCIQSCLKQTYEGFELLLINDGSTDKSGAICDMYAQKDPRVKVIHKKNGGVSSARNAGLKHAAGDYIIFVDSDDWINEDFLERISLIGDEADFLIFGIRFCFKEHNVETVPSKTKKTFSVHEFLASSELYAYKSSLTGPVARVFKKRIIDSFNLTFDETMSFAEDSLFNVHYLERCNTVLMDENWFYNCNKTNLNSITHRVIKNQADARLKYITAADAFFSTHMSDANYEVFVKQQLYNLISSISYCFLHVKDRGERIAVIRKISGNRFLRTHKSNFLSRKQRLILFVLHRRWTYLCYGIFALGHLFHG